VKKRFVVFEIFTNRRVFHLDRIAIPLIRNIVRTVDIDGRGEIYLPFYIRSVGNTLNKVSSKVFRPISIKILSIDSAGDPWAVRVICFSFCNSSSSISKQSKYLRGPVSVTTKTINKTCFWKIRTSVSAFSFRISQSVCDSKGSRTS